MGFTESSRIRAQLDNAEDITNTTQYLFCNYELGFILNDHYHEVFLSEKIDLLISCFENTIKTIQTEISHMIWNEKSSIFI